MKIKDKKIFQLQLEKSKLRHDVQSMGAEIADWRAWYFYGDKGWQEVPNVCDHKAGFEHTRDKDSEKVFNEVLNYFGIWEPMEDTSAIEHTTGAVINRQEAATCIQKLWLWDPKALAFIKVHLIDFTCHN